MHMHKPTSCTSNVVLISPRCVRGTSGWSVLHYCAVFVQYFLSVWATKHTGGTKLVAIGSNCNDLCIMVEGYRTVWREWDK